MAETPDLVALAERAADSAGIPRQLMFGVIKRESDWNPSAVSPAGALGLMQIMPIWATPAYAASIGMPGLTVAALLDRETNLTAGSRILAAELARFGGSWELALMAYNGGPTAVFNAIKAAGTRDPATVSEYLKAAETRTYWQVIMNYARMYANQIDAAAAALENVATEAVENIKESGTAGPLLVAGIFILGVLWWINR